MFRIHVIHKQRGGNMNFNKSISILMMCFFLFNCQSVQAKMINADYPGKNMTDFEKINTDGLPDNSLYDAQIKIHQNQIWCLYENGQLGWLTKEESGEWLFSDLYDLSQQYASESIPKKRYFLSFDFIDQNQLVVYMEEYLYVMNNPNGSLVGNSQKGYFILYNIDNLSQQQKIINLNDLLMDYIPISKTVLTRKPKIVMHLGRLYFYNLNHPYLYQFSSDLREINRFYFRNLIMDLDFYDNKLLLMNGDNRLAMYQMKSDSKHLKLLQTYQLSCNNILLKKSMSMTILLTEGGFIINLIPDEKLNKDLVNCIVIKYEEQNTKAESYATNLFSDIIQIDKQTLLIDKTHNLMYPFHD